MTQTRTPTRRRTRLIALLLPVVLVLVGITANAPAASAQGSASFLSWSQPTMYTVRTISDGSTFSFSNAPVGSTITTMSGSFSFTFQPSGMAYQAYLCLDLADTQCLYVGPPSNEWSYSSWSFSLDVSSLALPAYTTFHLAVYVDDGSTSIYHTALNPPMYLTTSRRVTIFYT